MGARVFGQPANAISGAPKKDHCMAICFGTIAAGSVPQLANSGRPIIKRSMMINLTAAKANTPAILLTGFSRTKWGGFSLPLGLRQLGAAGCSLLSSFDRGIPLSTSATGTASFTIPVPDKASLVKAKFYNQFMIVDARANSFGWSFSNAGEALIGDR